MTTVNYWTLLARLRLRGKDAVIEFQKDIAPILHALNRNTRGATYDSLWFDATEDVLSIQSEARDLAANFVFLTGDGDLVKITFRNVFKCKNLLTVFFLRTDERAVGITETTDDNVSPLIRKLAYHKDPVLDFYAYHELKWLDQFVPRDIAPSAPIPCGELHVSSGTLLVFDQSKMHVFFFGPHRTESKRTVDIPSDMLDFHWHASPILRLCVFWSKYDKETNDIAIELELVTQWFNERHNDADCAISEKFGPFGLYWKADNPRLVDFCCFHRTCSYTLDAQTCVGIVPKKVNAAAVCAAE